MTTIRAIDFVKSGFSAEDALALIPSIDAAKDSGEEFSIDFSGVHYFTTLFFSSALTRLIGELGEVAYACRVHVTNLSDSGAETYKHALDYAIKYFKKAPEEREKDKLIVKDVMEDN
jgi:hypothetical protein